MGKLIRLELYNFKSYKGHHALLFGDSYFTSIIGPNGSGKSNSMDAISFVLGIKSSFLRSTHLRDLVYRGRVLKTAKIGANGDAVEQTNGQVNGKGHASDDESTQQASQQNDPSSAWVMAVYEDDAGEEQKWKRTVTSAGQSEYRINNKVVTAGVYNDSLEAENILIKARNFLVFQGDVENIANQTPKDLARLIEQISGSLDHKANYERLELEEKKASDDHIEKTNQKRTINTEIRRYSDEKKEADNYNRKVDERDDAIVTHVLWKLYHFQQVMEESSAEIERFQDELKEYKRGLEKYDKAFEDAKKEQSRIGREVASHERTIKKTHKAADDKRTALDPIDEKLKLSRKNQEKFNKRLATITKERDAQSDAVQQLNKNLSTIQKAQSKWEQEWKQQSKKEGRQLSEADLQEYNQLRTDVNKRTANAQIKLNDLTRQRKTDDETVISFKAKTEECEAKLSRLQEELKELQTRRSEHKATADETSRRVAAKKTEYNQLTSNRLTTERRHTELDEKLQVILQKLLDADDGRRQSEKEIRSKETLLDMKRKFTGVRGRVHELCKPKQKKYDTAVSTALGRHFDSIVVDTDATAKRCIEYLRERRVAPTTFLPLDSIQVTSANSSMKGVHQRARLAMDVIEYETSVERALLCALGSTLICDDLDIARHLCYGKKVNAKAVTLDGTVIHKGGLMTGGQGPNDNKQRKVWDESEVDNLRRLKDKFLGDISALPRPQESALQEESLQSELFGLQQKVTFAQDEIKALDKNLESKEKESEHVQEQLDEYKLKYEDHSNSFELLQGRISAEQKNVDGVEDEVFAGFCKRLKYDNIRAYEAQQGTLQQEASQKKLEFNKQRTRLESQRSFETQRLQSTEDRIKHLKDTSERDRALVTDLETEKEDLQAKIEESDEQVEQLQEQLEQVKKTLDDQAALVAEARGEVAKRQRNIESTTRSITGLEAEVQRNSSSRYALLRKCKIDGIKVPVTEDSEPLEALPVEEALQMETGPNAMDIDEDTTRIGTAPVQDYGVEVDFTDLEDDLKEDNSTTQDNALQSAIANLTTEFTSLTPNMRALDRLATAKDKLSALEIPFAESRHHRDETHNKCEDVRSKRAGLFEKAYKHISTEILPIYKKLTQSADLPDGGAAHLNMLAEDDARPWEGGIKYNARPPTKRFGDMSTLSGGEKTIAALALLFAVHSYAPSPFFVLDEVDAALDNANIAKVARYIREHKGPGMQFVVISLKTGLFQESDTLCGIMRDQGSNTSRAVTLDLRKYQPS